MPAKKLTSSFKSTILTGLAALFPILITIFLLTWLYGQLDRTIGQKVNGVLRTAVVRNEGLFEFVFPQADAETVDDLESRKKHARQHFPAFVGTLVGFVGALVIVYVIGLFLRGYIGYRILRGVDSFFERFPVIKAIYPYARQVADLLFGSHQRVGFRHVVAVQYPRRGLYTIGFLTGEGLKDVEKVAGQSLVAVFIPTSPTPLTGFIILTPQDEVTELDMTVEEAFRFSMTAGMVASARQRPWEKNRDRTGVSGVQIPEEDLDVVEEQNFGAEEDVSVAGKGSEE
ncbi:MAG: DUF502 domain-containing protein [Candidatus Brocadiia bacterium]